MAVPSRAACLAFGTALFCFAAAVPEADKLNELGRSASARGDYKNAARLYEQALLAHRAAGGDEMGEAALLANVGTAKARLRRFDEAETYMLQAIAIEEHGPNERLARDLSNLAVLKSSRERYEAAEPLYRRALEILENDPGRNAEASALCLESLAELCRRTRRPDEAEGFFRRAVAAWERALGPLHHELAAKLEHYAGFLRKTEQFAAAAEFDARAMRIRVKTALPSSRPGE
jgi:tetratricopeptide (TPR) repeat protein